MLRTQRAFALIVCALGAAVMFWYYGAASRGSEGYVLPLDDVYIHFQYAHQIAEGQPYRYNPGQPRTSGATSFLYPYMLAAGYAAGFQQLDLSLWAMMIGTLMLMTSSWLVYLLVSRIDAPVWIHLILTLTFTISGAMSWHYMSGMETGLVTTCVLLTFYAFVERRARLLAFAASLLALSRPEGSIMAAIAVVVWLLTEHRDAERGSWRWMTLPLLAVAVQPLVNFAITGTLSASGNQAKSLFGLVPPYPERIAERIAAQFAQMWLELATGVSASQTLYLPPLFGLIAAAGLFLHNRRRPGVVILMLGWLVVVTAAVSTLDTAFWHFKRYQIPLLALLFPLAGWAILRIPRRNLRTAAALGVFLTARVSLIMFYESFTDNVEMVREQPLVMARWLAINTPPDATVAVHDVGMMRYLGERTTLDMVGLTTPGAADAWRNGPGAVAEFLDHTRPDYVAAYTDARGLSYLAATGIYRNIVFRAGLPFQLAELVRRGESVALAGTVQVIAAPDWTAADRAPSVQQRSSLVYLEGLTLVDSLDVADLRAEQQHRYSWQNVSRAPGFPTEVYEQGYLDCDTCVVLDGGRRIDGQETFTLVTRPGEDLLLVTRVHPQQAGTITIAVGGTPQARRWIPAQPGAWLELVTRIPAEAVTGDHTVVTITPDVRDGYYMPYMHWAYQGTFSAHTPSGSALATYQDGALALAAAQWEIVGDALYLDLTWFTPEAATGDYVVFVHVYDDLQQPPTAQAVDRRLGGNTLPPGNLLPGSLSDRFVVDLSGIRSGQLAIGLYDPVTGTRLSPISHDTGLIVESDRLFLGDIAHGRRP